MPKFFKYFLYEFSIFLLLAVALIYTIAFYKIDQGLFYPVILLIACATALGLLIPNVLLSVVVLELIGIGGSILLIGRIIMPLPIKIAVLTIFPVISFFATLTRQNIHFRRSAFVKRGTLRNFVKFFDPITDLRSLEQARHMYHRYIRFITLEKRFHLKLDVNLIELTNYEQYKELDNRQYDRIMKSSSETLKYTRFPYEHIFYVGQGKFLILSQGLKKEERELLKQVTKTQLDLIHFNFNNKKHDLTFKIVDFYIDDGNAMNYQSLSKLIVKLDRELEVDLTQEYL